MGDEVIDLLGTQCAPTWDRPEDRGEASRKQPSGQSRKGEPTTVKRNPPKAPDSSGRAAVIDARTSREVEGCLMSLGALSELAGTTPGVPALAKVMPKTLANETIRQGHARV
jgi:hypothetical protein